MKLAGWAYVLLVVYASAFALGMSASAGVERATVVHYFRGFEGRKIAAGVSVVWSGQGRCDGASSYDNHPGARTCGASRPNRVVRFGEAAGQACFSATPHGERVLCPMWPWSRNVIDLRLARPLGDWRRSYAKLWTKAQSNWARLPWGVWTTGGKRCLRINPNAAGGPESPHGWETYYCSNSSMLVGFPNRSAPVWTLWYARGKPGHWHYTRVGITDAWR